MIYFLNQQECIRLNPFRFVTHQTPTEYKRRIAIQI